uniref:Secreted protein n=1 Tax=Steinernema glaseri TaxID=37863 RepID=A0A1I7XXM2_9BILA
MISVSHYFFSPFHALTARCVASAAIANSVDDSPELYIFAQLCAPGPRILSPFLSSLEAQRDPHLETCGVCSMMYFLSSRSPPRAPVFLAPRNLASTAVVAIRARRYSCAVRHAFEPARGAALLLSASWSQGWRPVYIPPSLLSQFHDMGIFRLHSLTPDRPLVDCSSPPSEHVDGSYLTFSHPNPKPLITPRRPFHFFYADFYGVAHFYVYVKYFYCNTDICDVCASSLVVQW